MLPICVFGIITVSFFLLALLPGDIPHAVLGPIATPQAIIQVEVRLGLNHSVFVRYWDYVVGISHGTLGSSYYTGDAVISDIGSRLPATLELVIPSLLLAMFLGVGLGAVGAYYSGGMPDKIARAGMTVAQSIPDFLLALLLILLFFSTLHWLPGPEGQLSFADSTPPHVTGMYVVDAVIAGDWALAVSAVRHLILPVATLAIVYSAVFGRTTRALMGTALTAEYTRFGRASGWSERRLIWNAVLATRTSLLTYAAVLAAGIIGGDAIIEIVFSWNGLGQWAVQSMLRQDLPAVEGYVVVVGSVTVVIYLVLDLVSSLLDPRIRFNANRDG
jgi:ABC-type dipeptide/oligopeptide/nickel transport system permease component